MARPIHAKDVGLSLAKLVAHYGLGYKDQSALIATKGKNLCDFSDDEIDEMRIYNAADVDQCYGLLLKLIPQTRKEEVKLVDMTIRMLVEPTFESDATLLANTLTEEGVRKKAMLVEAARKMDVYEIGMDDDEAASAALTVLSSAAKFAAFLRTIEVDVPTKVSPTTGKEIPALAKTDEGFLALQEHDDPLVATAAAARLDAKSTILQTRIQAFMDASNAHPQKKGADPAEVLRRRHDGPLVWLGLQPTEFTTREPVQPPPVGRTAPLARQHQPGQKVVVADLSGIELRVNHFLWQVPSSVEMYQAEPEKADLYKDFRQSALRH